MSSKAVRGTRHYGNQFKFGFSVLSRQDRKDGGSLKERNRLILYLHQAGYLFIKFLEICGAYQASANVFLLIDDVGGRQAGDAAVTVGNLLIATDDRVIHLVVFIERSQFAFVIVNRDSNHLKFILIFFLQPHELRDFFCTGCTPCRPEIHKQDFSPIVASVDVVSIQISHCQIRYSRPGWWGRDRLGAIRKVTASFEDDESRDDSQQKRYCSAHIGFQLPF